MNLLFLLFGTTHASESDRFLSLRGSLAPGAYSNGHIESYSIGAGFQLPTVGLVLSLEYTQNAYMDISYINLPHSIGPSLQIRSNLLQYSLNTLYFSIKVSALLGVHEDSFVLQQNLGLGLKGRLLKHSDKNNVFLCSEIGTLALMWVPYFSLELILEI
ncbi:MAG: hypothetical protein VX278_00820 [Myxococcota bacterium]|nr:hypothetical protein [Myxococcota bacterium]